MESVILRNRRPKPGSLYADPMLANRTSQLIVADQICASRPPRRAFQYAPKKAPSKTDGAKHTIARGTAVRAPKSPDHDHQHGQGAKLDSNNALPATALQHRMPTDEPTNACSAQAHRKVLEKRNLLRFSGDSSRLKAGPEPEIRVNFSGRPAVRPAPLPG